MQRDPAYDAFRRFLHGSIAETLLWWVQTRPGERIDPDKLADLTTRRIPRSRSGKLNFHCDESIWALGKRHA